MSVIIKSELYVMSNSNGKIYNNMSTSQRIKALIDEGKFEKNINLICSRPIGVLFDHNTNYATEIVSKIKIPVLFYDKLTGTYNGKIQKPYFVLVTVNDLVPLIQHISDNSLDKESIKKYKLLHQDSDGSSEKFKENLRKILLESEMLFNSVPVLKYVKSNDKENSYKELQRTRKK